MKTPDNVSPKLREIEKEIDNYYKSNPLLKLPFGAAARSLLAYAEEYMLNELTREMNRVQNSHAIGSDFITELEHSMSWIYGACEQGGKISYTYNTDLYNASKDLFELGQNTTGSFSHIHVPAAKIGYLTWNSMNQLFNQQGIFSQV